MTSSSAPDGVGQSRNLSAIIVGIAAIVVGVVWNEAVLGGLLSPDGSIGRPSFRIAVGLFNVGLIAFGVFAIVRRVRFPEMAVRAAMIVASFSACVALLLATDVIVGRISPLPPYITFPEPANWATSDEHGITQGVPGRHRINAYSSAGGELYDISYTFDQFGRRKTPVAAAEQRDRHAIFAGGSFTFGTSVEDDETFPAYVGELTTRYRPYNYGFHGWGPADALMEFERRPISAEVGETSGLLIFLFIDQHIGRTIGSMHVTGSWGSEKIHYDLTPSGDLVFGGSFANDHPLRTYLYRQLYRSNILRLLGVDLPVYSKRHAEFTARVLEELSAQYKLQFPEGEFVVVFYPGYERSDDMIPEFEARNIKYLEYRLDQHPAYSERMPIDNHPTAAAYRALAEAVVRDLELE